MTTLAQRLHLSPAKASPAAFDRKLIAPMVLGSIMNPVNSSMLAVALIPIGLAFGTSPSTTAWLVSALYVTTAVGQPVVGRLVDMFGPRPLYLIGTALVGVAGVLGALAPSLGVLIVARVLIGLGTCAGYPASMYLIRSESRRTGQDSPAGILSILALSNQVIAVIGPTIGGLLIGVGGWRAIFTVNIPLSIAALALGWLRMPRSLGNVPHAKRNPLAMLDLPGIALFATTLIAFMLFLMDPEWAKWCLVVLAIVAGTAFAVRELRVADPFIDLRVLGGNRPLVATYVRQLLSYTVSYAFLYGFTQWLEASRGLSASAAGLMALPTSAMAIAVTIISGRRVAVRGKVLVGALTQIVACLLLLMVSGASAMWILAGIALLLGIPQGLNGLANQNALYYQADPDRLASAAGLLRTFMYLGAMCASAANAAFFVHGATTAGIHELSTFALACAAVLLILALADRSLGDVGARRTASAT